MESFNDILKPKHQASKLPPLPVMDMRNIPFGETEEYKELIKNQQQIIISLNTVTANQKVMFETMNQAVVKDALTEEEQKIVPEDQLDSYVKLKESNPQLAKTLLKGWTTKPK